MRIVLTPEAEARKGLCRAAGLVMGAVLPVLLLLHLAASRTDTGIRLLTKDSELERNAPGAAGRAAAPLPPGLGGGGGEAIAGFFFQPWLDADLAPWAVTGISEALVRAAHKKARVCWGGLGPEGALRATIISGALWAVLDPPGPGGHYAAQLGPGWASGKGRIPYALLSIVDALREAPPGGWAERWGSAADGRCCGLAWRCQPTNPACFYAPLPCRRRARHRFCNADKRHTLHQVAAAWVAGLVAPLASPAAGVWLLSGCRLCRCACSRFWLVSKQATWV